MWLDLCIETRDNLAPHIRILILIQNEWHFPYHIYCEILFMWALAMNIQIRLFCGGSRPQLTTIAGPWITKEFQGKIHVR